jgi:hypothetical protein
MPLNRTNRHLLYALAWLLGFVVLVQLAVTGPLQGASGAIAMVYAQFATIAWVLGFAAIFFSWARLDAEEHGKSRSVAVMFALLWLLFNVLSHVAYLFLTRGWREGLLSTAKFICFVLGGAILLVALAKLLHGFT